MELLLCFESFFLAPSRSARPQENRSAAIMTFTVSYTAYLSNFTEDYYARQSLARSQKFDPFIQCVLLVWLHAPSQLKLACTWGVVALLL